jgi:DNA-binding phage protein
MSKHLRKVATTRVRWHTTCEQANDAYIQAIRDARAAGHTMPEIGEAAGISKQGVRYLLLKGKP